MVSFEVSVWFVSEVELVSDWVEFSPVEEVVLSVEVEFPEVDELVLSVEVTFSDDVELSEEEELEVQFASLESVQAVEVSVLEESVEF